MGRKYLFWKENQKIEPAATAYTHVQGVLVNGDDFSLGSRPESDTNAISRTKMSLLRLVMTLVRLLREDIANRDHWVSHEPCYRKHLIRLVLRRNSAYDATTP
jgi:hypothetical protein